MIVFGLNLSHDDSCAAVVDGEVRVAIENERLSRIKHNEGRNEFGKMVPFASIHYCCETLGITPADVDLWVVNSVHRSAVDIMRAQALGIPAKKIIGLGIPGHHLAHAYSAYYCSPFEDAAVIVVDTNGGYAYRAGTRERTGHYPFPPLQDTRARQENYSIYAGRQGHLREVAKDWLRQGEIGIGQLYMLYSAMLQLTPRPSGYYGKDDALAAGGKLMGYAAYDLERTTPPHVWPARGGHLAMAMADFVAMFRKRGFITAVKPGADWNRTWSHQLQRVATFKPRECDLHDPAYVSLGGEAQRLMEEAFLRIGELAARRTGLTKVCFAGGNALNITALALEMDQGRFTDIFVQPAANDAGNAIGAAFYGYVSKGGRKRPYLSKPYTSFLGRTYSSRDVAEALRAMPTPLTFTHVRQPRREQIASALKHLLAQRVIAICRGGSEFGPRALGHRSLLASPRRAAMTTTLNRIKGREWYRPVAPMVCEEDFERYFEGPVTRMPFMTLSARVSPTGRKWIPAACHVDGSARVQTVSRQSDPFMHALLKAHEAESGVPVLINTSFNFGGEPIVETPADAIASFARTKGVACLLVEDYCLEKRSLGA
ncbi:MAG: carbamoyltransferase C-terminal domain-containing protein [Vicinamibacterales bacterium]